MKCEIILATVADDASGIHLRVRTEEDKFFVCFTPTEVWGRIPTGKNRKDELEKVASLLNGYERDSQGNVVQVPGFIPRTITLTNE